MEHKYFFNFKNNLICNIEDYLTTFDNKNFKKVVFLPSFLEISQFFNKKTVNFELGMQNICTFEDMTITGEVNVKMAKNYGIKYCIVGHSERRYKLDETNDEIKEKILLLLKNNIIPILCVGELKQDSEVETLEFIKNQLDVLDVDYKNIIVAYEPVFSIGTGVMCETSHIENVCKMIKEKFNPNLVLYGGSVNDKNVGNLKAINYVDGFLIGGASLDINKVNKIIAD